jgi:thiol:disulfide interchange protein
LKKVLCFALFSFAPLVNGAPRVQTAHVQAELLTASKSVSEGATVLVGLRLKLAPKWHVYWRNPGDSGEAPTIEWSVPEGSIPGPILWPTPTSIPVPPLLNYGYTNEVTLLTEISVGPATKGLWKVKANAQWLVCEEICVPESAELELSIPWQALQEDSPDKAHLESVRQGLPRALPDWTSRFEITKDKIHLKVNGPKETQSAQFFPFSDAVLRHSAEQNFRKRGTSFELELTPSDLTPLPEISSLGLSGILFLSDGTAVEIAAQSEPPSRSLWQALLFAFLGGLVLNLMPCVFPVLSLKVLGFAEMGGADQRRNVLHSIAYTLGILVSFWALAGTLIALRAGGQALGWGFQLQSPLFLALLAFLLIAMALELFGLFEVDTRFSGSGQGLASKEGLPGAFFSGVLATLVATPCTAPFMGPAMGYALAAPPALALLVFSLLGLGLAAPYVFFSVFPALTRALPRPGAWMITFKQLMGFPLLLTAWWLLSVLALQTSTVTVFHVLLASLGLAFGLWMFGKRTKFFSLMGILVVFMSVGWAVRQIQTAPAQSSTSVSQNGWQNYSEETLQSALNQGLPVFIDFTAAWCITCQVNERIALETPAVRKRFEEKKVLLLKADWTHQDAAIAKKLESFGRNGVPLYALYLPGIKEPRILPQILTPDIVLAAVNW